MDARRKDRQLQDWDQVLAATRAEIEAVEADQRSRLERLNIKGLGEVNTVDDSHSDRTAWLDQVTWGDMIEWASIRKAERKSRDLQAWKGISLDTLKKLTDVDLTRILLDKRLLIRFYAGPDCASLEFTPATHVYSPKKLRTLEWSLIKLVSKYLQLAHADNSQAPGSSDAVLQDLEAFVTTKGTTAADLAEDVETCDIRLRHLYASTRDSNIYANFPSPHSMRYRWSPSERKEELMAFNQRLQQLLYSTPIVEKFGIQQICHMLLNARTASDVHTYNLLLVRFCQLRADSFVLATYESFLECHIRPNEITHATMLRYFTLTNNQKAFNLYLQRMNGFKQGLAIADPDKAIDPLVASRYREFGQTRTKLAELARINAEVYTCLIKGLIEMSRLTEALWYFRNMMNEGWEPGMELLHSILKSCLAEADAVSGWQIWKKMVNIRTPEDPITTEMRDLMIQLCKNCEKFNMSTWIQQEWMTLVNTVGKHAERREPTPATPLEIESAIRLATRDALTPRVLADRFPYVDSSTIEDRLNSSLNVDIVQHESLMGIVVDVASVYCKMTSTLRLSSLSIARTFIEDHTNFPFEVKRAMIDEVYSCFNLLGELSDLDKAQQLEVNQTPVEQASLPIAAIDHAKQPSQPITLARGEILSEIQQLDASLAPDVILQAYNSFREGVQSQRPGQQSKAPLSTTRPTVTHMISKPLKATRIEAG